MCPTCILKVQRTRSNPYTVLLNKNSPALPLLHTVAGIILAIGLILCCLACFRHCLYRYCCAPSTPELKVRLVSE